MLVPSMTLEEIRKEIDKDYPILFRKAGYVMHKLERVLSKPEKEQGFVHFYDYCSKYKNHWIYRIQITKKESSVSCLLLYHNDRGHVAIGATPDRTIVYYTGHFFERFNQRCKLGLKSLDDIYHAYLNSICRFGFIDIEEIAPDVFKTFCVIESGIILGMHNRRLKLFKANTFISNDMLRNDQLQLKIKVLNPLPKVKPLLRDIN